VDLAFLAGAALAGCQRLEGNGVSFPAELVEERVG
jgi:hypothetical protein